MIRKVCEVDPMTCPKCGGMMKIVAFITDFSVVDRIINHLKLTFVADKPPPSRNISWPLIPWSNTFHDLFSERFFCLG
jgi:hypothetical protein